MGASSMPSLENRFLTHISWQLVSDKDIYSASVEESIMVFYTYVSAEYSTG